MAREYNVTVHIQRAKRGAVKATFGFIIGFVCVFILLGLLAG